MKSSVMKPKASGNYNPFSRIFDEGRLFSDIRRSAYFMTVGNICGGLFGVVSATGSTALTGYSAYLGTDDFEYGILTGIAFAAALMQIPFSLMVTRTHKRKKYMMTYGLISRIMWLLIGLVPFLIPSQMVSFRIWSVIFLIGISSVGGACINVCWMPWMADIVPDTIRGRWLSIRDGFGAILNVLFGIAVAGMLDRMPDAKGYAIVFLIGGTFGIMDMLCFAFMKEVYTEEPAKLHIIPVLKMIMKDKPFFRFMMFWTAWNFTANMSGAYLGRYSILEMGLSYTVYTVCSQVAAAFVTILVISHWGRLLDKYGCKPVLMVGGIVASITPAFYLFSVYGSIWPTLLHNAVGAAFWVACNLAATNMQITDSPSMERPSYLAVFSCVTSLLGAFLGIFLGGILLEVIHDSAVLNSFIPDRYKFVIAISVVLRFACVLIIVPMLRSNRQWTTKAMIHDLVTVKRR